MVEVTAKVKGWGRSLGFLIPKEAAVKENLSIGTEIRALIFKKKNPLKETFGMAKFSRSTKQILEELDKEGWNV